jgi:hypothetical protein
VTRLQPGSERKVRLMPLFKGKTKAKPGKEMYIRSGGRSGRWHRLDPRNGRRTACGIDIDTMTWGLPVLQVPVPDSQSVDPIFCRFKECNPNYK